jgi:type III pantothenate kinase
MNLVIDIGNSSTKLALYNGPDRFSVSRIDELSCTELEKNLTRFEIDKVIISSVKDLPPFVSDLISVNIPFVHILSYKSRFPFIIDYETPETLGTDRIAGAAGAIKMFPDSDILVIDSGTAIKYEYISKGVFKGGNISPGLNMRFKALNIFTGRLPLVLPDDGYSFPGQNTRDAISAGVITGLMYEINEYIRTFMEKDPTIKVILTGGDSDFLKNKINHNITHVPDLVIDGLNFILEYNAT